VVIKEPNGSYAADVIMEVFSFSKIIFLARDGRDVVDSKLDIYQKNTWAQKWINLPSVTSSNKKWLIISESNIWRMLMETANKVYKSMPAEKNC
jgi:hypothetical protein